MGFGKGWKSDVVDLVGLLGIVRETLYFVSTKYRDDFEQRD